MMHYYTVDDVKEQKWSYGSKSVCFLNIEYF